MTAPIATHIMATTSVGVNWFGWTIAGGSSFVVYQALSKQNAPTPYDFKTKANQEKTIVVVGGGMVGLSTAYILAKNYPKNHLVVLERNSKPLEGTSKQNGNLMPLDFTHSWMNVPIYPFVYKAIFDYKETPSRVYLSSFFQSFANILITAKFGIMWLFFQPNNQDFGVTLLKI